MMSTTTAGNLIPSSVNTPLDARSRVNLEKDILSIENPELGAIVYCIDTGKHYVITGLKSAPVGPLTVENAAVASYREIVPASNAKVTINQDGVTKGSFTLNQANEVTIDLAAGGSGVGAEQVQADWSETNETSKAFIKNKPLKLSQFSNDEGYQTASEVGSAVSSAVSGLATKEELAGKADAGDLLKYVKEPDGISPNQVGLLHRNSDGTYSLISQEEGSSGIRFDQETIVSSADGTYGVGKIPVSSVSGMDAVLSSKADKSYVEEQISMLDGKVVSMVRFKGVKNSVDELEQLIGSPDSPAQVGDLWLIRNIEQDGGNLFEEYVCVEDSSGTDPAMRFELVGSVDSSALSDLSNRLVAAEASLSEKVDNGAMLKLLGLKQDKIDSSHKISHEFVEGLVNANNATVTVNQGGVTKGSFTLNQSDPVVINLDVGGAGGVEQVQADWDVSDSSSKAFILNKPLKVSQFNNDEGYQTASEVGSAVSSAVSGLATKEEVAKKQDQINGENKLSSDFIDFTAGQDVRNMEISLSTEDYQADSKKVKIHNLNSPVIGLKSPNGTYYSMERDDCSLGINEVSILMTRYLAYEKEDSFRPGWIAYVSGAGKPGRDGESVEESRQHAKQALDSSEAARISEEKAAASATAAKDSAVAVEGMNAQLLEKVELVTAKADEARASAQAAKTSETKAAQSAQQAQDAASTAATSAASQAVSAVDIQLQEKVNAATAKADEASVSAQAAKTAAQEAAVDSAQAVRTELSDLIQPTQQAAQQAKTDAQTAATKASEATAAASKAAQDAATVAAAAEAVRTELSDLIQPTQQAAQQAQVAAQTAADVANQAKQLSVKYVGCLCLQSPPSLFDGMIWIRGGTDSPEYITGVSSPAIVTDGDPDPASVDNYTIVIVQ